MLKVIYKRKATLFSIKCFMFLLLKNCVTWHVSSTQVCKNSGSSHVLRIPSWSCTSFWFLQVGSFLSCLACHKANSFSKSGRVFTASVFILFARHASGQWFPPHVTHFLLANAIHQEYEKSLWKEDDDCIMILRCKILYPPIHSEVRIFCW